MLNGLRSLALVTQPVIPQGTESGFYLRVWGTGSQEGTLIEHRGSKVALAPLSHQGDISL